MPGIISARLAAAGFTSSPDALEHPLGFLAAVSPKGAADRERAIEAGRDWQILTQGLGVKNIRFAIARIVPSTACLIFCTSSRCPAMR